MASSRRWLMAPALAGALFASGVLATDVSAQAAQPMQPGKGGPAPAQVPRAQPAAQAPKGPAAPAARPAARQMAARPAAPAMKRAAPAPARAMPARATTMPRQLPRAGEADTGLMGEPWAIGGLAVAGLGLLGTGLVVRRRAL